MPTEGLRTFVYMVQIGILFAVLYFIDVTYVKNLLLFYLILGVNVALAIIFTYLLAKSIQKYFNY
ncbi:hypothetical protein [Sulfolobus sp. E11-6]|uniref:hypothetical protein n=1 Tax=Sulfolobus sp. E11-6 TaxID=2663020 RepID=UPI001296D17D|nr:hypothetical protein [Sulfolobus sp. E11-6]QGA69235.1 hypothetical protein GFS33_11485 [Sulfolobus sp. E11-6]